MAHWLIKSEPDVWSWDDQVAAGRKGEPWSGVRNHQANNNMKAMQLGDRAFFYHSNEQRAAVGIVEVVRLWYPDPAEPTGRFGMVDVAALEPLPRAVTLAEIKAEPRLAEMVLVKNSRLSVQPVLDEEWAVVCEMAGRRAGDDA